MEDEIDVRPYIETLLRHWYWIIGAAIIGGVVAFGVASLLPPTYEATALVAVIPSSDVIQFDERFRQGVENQPLRAFPQLAMSDHVLQTLLEQSENDDLDSLEKLRRRISANTGDDTTIIRLSAESDNPEKAALLVNDWAAIFIDWANNVYGEQSGENVRFFEEQLAVAEDELAASERALIDFQAINRTQIISTTLATFDENRAMLLNSQNRTDILLQDAQLFRDQLAQQPDNVPVTFSDQLTALTLQFQVLNIYNDLPLQLQVGPTTSLTGDSRSEQLKMLDNIQTTLMSQSEQINNELSEIEPKILSLQQQLQEEETEYGRLIREQIVAEETYTALAHKVQEERITSADTTKGVRLASEAAVPVDKKGPRKLVYIVFASMLGGTLAIVMIFSINWWRQNDDR